MSRVCPTVYLAGPITGCDYTGATEWREEVRRVLQVCGIVAFSPMRSKDYLRKQGILRGDPEAYTTLGLSAPKGIVTRDRFDCTTVDLVLANLLPAEETGLVSVGTMIEFGWADANRIPIIVAMTERNPMYHAMVTEIAGFVVSDIDSAVRLTQAILLPDPSVDLDDLHMTQRKGGGL